MVTVSKDGDSSAVLFTLVGVVLGIALVYALTVERFQVNLAKPEPPAVVAARVATVGKLTLAGETPPGAEAGAAVASDPGPALYNRVCMACHASGAAGAPILGNREAWAPRLGQGLDGLLGVAIAGKGAMPPRGGCVTCTDEELRQAIAYMLAQVGVTSEAPGSGAPPATSAIPAQGIATPAEMPSPAPGPKAETTRALAQPASAPVAPAGQAGQTGQAAAPTAMSDPAVQAQSGYWVPPGGPPNLTGNAGQPAEGVSGTSPQQAAPPGTWIPPGGMPPVPPAN